MERLRTRPHRCQDHIVSGMHACIGFHRQIASDAHGRIGASGFICDIGTLFRPSYRWYELPVKMRPRVETMSP